jgi:3-hydroxyacyl-[acyl-carrier-protein] dehydratase
VSDFPKPIDILPHRDPFLLVTEITALQPGVSVSATWTLTGDEGFFAGHFPGRPTVPGVLMVESLAQVGAIGVLTDERFAGKLPLLAGVDNARFRRQAVPGDTLELHVELGRLSGRAGKGSGKVLINGQLACQADLLFVLADL